MFEKKEYFLRFPDGKEFRDKRISIIEP